VALAALAIGIAPNVPGFLAAAGGPAAAPLFVRVYEWAWFVSFILAGAVYLAGMKLLTKK
jgi:NCS1 family nucleobase:cation symporter-1